MNCRENINGIQQLGIGCEDLYTTWQWYIDHLGIDIRILEDDTVAERMLPYTGGQPQKRHAAIAVTLQGGSGFEIWQYSERKPSACPFTVAAGDLGVFAAKIRSHNVAAFHREISASYDNVSAISALPDGTPCFCIRDPWGNALQVVEDTYIYLNRGRNNGGICGACIGVSDVDRSLSLYRDILGYDNVVYDSTGVFTDLDPIAFAPGGSYRRVLLKRSTPCHGAFSEVFGPATIELVQCLDREPRKIYEGRYWGDPGFIQICFDVKDMKALGSELTAKGYPFTVDSCPDGEIFDMGEASGHFTYIEDPDGTLIEFVQTHKIPVLKALGIWIDLDKRGQGKPLPKTLMRLMSFTAIKKLK